MIVNWPAFLLGFAVGAPVSLLFFAGLSCGMRLALQSSQAGAILLLSSICRITLLLAAGFWVTTVQGSGWPLAGYALAFLLIRLMAILWVRVTAIPSKASA